MQPFKLIWEFEGLFLWFLPPLNNSQLSIHDYQFAIRSGKPDALHVVVTGWNAPKSLLDAADLVTEMVETKHPFKNGIKAQKGIEF